MMISYMHFDPNAIHCRPQAQSRYHLLSAIMTSSLCRKMTKYQMYYRIISANQDYRLHVDDSRIYDMQPVESGNLYDFTPC